MVKGAQHALDLLGLSTLSLLDTFLVKISTSTYKYILNKITAVIPY